jgi:hypothetical protein
VPYTTAGGWASLDLAGPPPDLTGWLTGAAAIPGRPWHVVIENHPGCTPDKPHGIVAGGERLLACHATPEEARAIAEKLDLSEPSGVGDSSTGGTSAAFDPARHPRIEHGHGGGEFTHNPFGIPAPTPGTAGHLHDGITDPPPSQALKMKGAFTLAGLGPDDKLLGKVNAKLTRPLMGAGPNKGKVRRPAVPPYRQSVTKTSAAMMALIEQQGTLEEGKKWYPDEHEMNHRRALAYHVPIDRAIGVEAATCPRVQWIINQRVTNELLDEVPKAGRTIEKIKIAHHFGGGVMASFRDEGVDIILNGDVDHVLGGTKRRNFYNNIMWPGQTDSVTVDTWMLQALKPLGLNDQQAMALGEQSVAGLADGLGKVIVADALRDATARYRAQGVDITPDGVQAAAWIAIQKQLGLSDPSAHDNPRDTAYMLHAAFRSELHPRTGKGQKGAGEFARLELGGGGRHTGPGSFEHIRSIEHLADEIDTANLAGGGGRSETAAALRNVARHVGLRQVDVARQHMAVALAAAKRDKLGDLQMRDLRAIAASLDNIPKGTYPEPGFGERAKDEEAPPSIQRHRRQGPGYFPSRVHQAAAQPDPDDDGGELTDDQWDAELLLQYLEWLAEAVPGGVDLGSPGSARLTGGLAADNPAAWKLALADPRFGRLGMTTAQARQAARGTAPPPPAAPQAAWNPLRHPRNKQGEWTADGAAKDIATSAKSVHPNVWNMGGGGAVDALHRGDLREAQANLARARDFAALTHRDQDQAVMQRHLDAVTEHLKTPAQRVAEMEQADKPLINRAEVTAEPNYPGSAAKNVHDSDGNLVGMVFPHPDGKGGYQATDDQGAKIGLDRMPSEDAAIGEVVAERNRKQLTAAAASQPAGPVTVRENHPECPAHAPHGTVDSRTGELVMCHRTKDQAQDLALTLNFPDATPVTPGAVMQVGAAKGGFREDLHPRRGRGKGGGEFAPKGQGGGQPASQRTLQRRRQAEVRRHPGSPPARPGQPPPGAAGMMAAPQAQLAAADLSRLISDQVAQATDRLSREQHEQLREVRAELERSQAELAELHKTEAKTEEAAKEKGKTVRKLIHHVLALAAVAVLTFIGVKTGNLENPMFAGLAATGPLFLQEALDAVKRV